ncbi:MAG: response regulator [Alphaproteobacteria bacterium]|nr:response regulator [Alphaproteobacteria bacterium]
MSSLTNILLVEDNEDDYEAAVRSLKKNHFANPVQWCRNGQDGLDYLQRAGKYANNNTPLPGLILLDLNMPGIDGRQMLQKLKEDQALRAIPVVVLTTSSDSRDIEQCYQLGANTYIQKPVSFEGLVEAIRTMKEYWFGIALLPGQKDK